VTELVQVTVVVAYESQKATVEFDGLVSEEIKNQIVQELEDGSL
jgi:hypothetical protein